MNIQKLLNLALLVIIGVLVVVGTAQAATTISTNVITEGRIGVGTTTPSASLSVVTDAASSAGAVGSVLDTSTAWTTNGSRLFSARNNGVEQLSISRNGGISIGRDIANQWGLAQDGYSMTSARNTALGEPNQNGISLTVSDDADAYSFHDIDVRLSGLTVDQKTSNGVTTGEYKTNTSPNGQAYIRLTSSGGAVSSYASLSTEATGANFTILSDGTPRTDFRPDTTSLENYLFDTSVDNSFDLVNFKENGTSRLTIDGNGKVGIGTSTPYSKFHVTAGASATTTVNFGEVGVSSSKACFNTKNTAGSDISFFFVGTTMVVENHLCR